MIKMHDPSMALNHPELWGYNLWNTRTFSLKDDIDGLLASVVTIAKGAPGGYLNHLVISTHGVRGRGGLGGRGFVFGDGRIYQENANKFGVFAGGPRGGYVRNIWLQACKVASIISPELDGNRLCMNIADYANGYVIASTAIQVKGCQDIPNGYIDDFEGDVYVYGPGQGVIYRFVNPLFSTWDKVLCKLLEDA